MPPCFNVSVYQMDAQPASWSNLLTPVLWLQFYHKMNDEKMDIDTSVGGNGSGESSISISYSKGCKSYASFEVTDISNTSVKKCF